MRIPTPTKWDIIHRRRLNISWTRISEELQVSIGGARNVYEHWRATGDFQGLKVQDDQQS